MEQYAYGFLRARFTIPSGRLSGGIDQVSACGWHDCNDSYLICRQQEKELMKQHFLLIYTTGGCGEASVEGEKYLLKPQTLMIFPKGSHHGYRTQKGGRWVFYWMHISGAHCSAMLSHLIRECGCCLNMSCGEKIVSCVEALISSALHHDEYDLFSAQQVSDMLFEVMREICLPRGEKRIRRDAVRRAIELMEKNYDRPLMIGEIAAQLYLSEEHVIRMFKKETGLTPHRYIRQLRINRACIYLEQSDMSIAQIAQSVGYQSVSSFVAQFRHSCGVTPGEYRRGHRRQNTGEGDSWQSLPQRNVF